MDGTSSGLGFGNVHSYKRLHNHFTLQIQVLIFKVHSKQKVQTKVAILSKCTWKEVPLTTIKFPFKREKIAPD